MAPGKMVSVSAYEMQMKRQQRRLKKKNTAGKPVAEENKKMKIGLKTKRKFKVQAQKKKKLQPFTGLESEEYKNYVGNAKEGKKEKRKKVPQSCYMETQVQMEQGSQDDVIELSENGTHIEVPDTEEGTKDSITEGEDTFRWLVSPIIPQEFFESAWEKTPLLIRRPSMPEYFSTLLTMKRIDNILHSNYILFSKHLDVTAYRDGKRETLNPPGRAAPGVVWDFYQQGCSVRMLNPQTFCPELGLLAATLQEFFGCFVGANSYLTPPGSQGFAPHYDDIEAFVLQVEGRKHWKVYAPRSQQEMLPRFSSPNFSQEEVGTPVLDVTLNAGDLLYFPRGFIHQASTDADSHSLHITLSCYQRHSWGDLLEKLLPAALSVAMQEDVAFRQGLPRDLLSHLGLVHSDRETQQRNEAFGVLRHLMSRLADHAPLDAVVDQVGKQLMHDALPPFLTTEEKRCSVFSKSARVLRGGRTTAFPELLLSTRVRLVRAHALRMVKEDDEEDKDVVLVYHCVDNALEYHGEEPQALQVPVDLAIGIEHLVHAYPQYTAVQELPLDTDEERLALASMLWRKGLLLTEKVLSE